MLENVKRVREPLGWALLALAAGTIAVGIAQLVIFLPVSRSSPTDVNWSLSLGYWGLSLLPYPLVLALVATICTCFVAPATPRALLLGRVAVWVLTIGAVAAVGGTLYGLRDLLGFQQAPPLDLLSSALGLLTGVVGIVALWVVVWRDPDDGEDQFEQDGEEVPQRGRELGAETRPEDSVPTAWAPTDASGTVWRTAADAAAGTPGSRYLSTDDDTPDAREGDTPEPQDGDTPEDAVSDTPANPDGDTPDGKAHDTRWSPPRG